MNIFKNLYNYRELLKTSVKKDIGGKYKHSFLGVLWSFVNPLLQIAVYAIVFPLIMRSNIEHYTVFMVCGLIPWQYFSQHKCQLDPYRRKVTKIDHRYFENQFHL